MITGPLKFWLFCLFGLLAFGANPAGAGPASFRYDVMGSVRYNVQLFLLIHCTALLM